MYPAKYSFDVTALPDCTNDFVVFPVSVNGSGSQPNIVGFDNLYSGTAGSTGMCNAPANGRTSGANDDGVSATVIWSYNVQIDYPSGQVSTSPALSLDGTKVAFVENDLTHTTFTQSYFHVLAPHRGDGVASNLQTVGSPVGISGLCSPPTVTTHCIVRTAPVANSGTDAFVQLGSIRNSDTFSSPFIDYNTDMAYVGDDTGVLYRIKNVFCTTPACIGGGSPGPSLDATWGSSGALTTGCSGALTSPVVARESVFVGCPDGKLYAFSTTTGTAIPGSPLTVGSGGLTGGIVDPPLVDVVNGFVYVVAGNSSGTGTPSVLVQASTASFTSPTPVVATLGLGGQFNLHTPAFNEAYFSSAFSSVSNVHGSTAGGSTSTGTTSNWQIYEWADSGVSGNLSTLYGVGFNSSSHDMTSGPAANFFELSGSTANEFSPLSQILNGSTDQLYVGGLTANTPNVLEYNVTDFPPGFFPNVVFPINSSNAAGASASEGSGTSGIVVDNVSSSGQASSIYFGVQVSNTAVKLTQSGLN
jgi:hypothetical protein